MNPSKEAGNDHFSITSADALFGYRRPTKVALAAEGDLEAKDRVAVECDTKPNQHVRKGMRE